MTGTAMPSSAATSAKRATRNLIVVATYDSFLKSALPIAQGLEKAGFAAHLILAEARANQISRRQLSSMNLDRPVEVRPLAGLPGDPAILAADLIILAMDGKRTAEFLWRFRHALPPGSRRRPITMAGYPGVVFRSHVHGLANRFGCDLILLNSPADYDDYLDVCARFGLAPTNGVCLGLSVLGGTTRRSPARTPPRSLLYCEQPDVPKLKIERLYVIDRLIAYARRHPDRRVLIKPRHTPTEITLKRTEHHLEPIVARVRRAGGLPANVELTYQPVERLLQEIDLCVTVSSTAALQAAAIDVPFAILADFGIREDYGTHFYMGSGCIRTFDQLEIDDGPGLDPAWAARHVCPGADRIGLLEKRIFALLDRQEAEGAPLPYVDATFGAECEALFRYKFGRSPEAGTVDLLHPARSTHRTDMPAWLRKTRKLVRSPRRFIADLMAKRASGRIALPSPSLR
ncbi:MAG: DUF6716 putative glycosyltransferase [Geminicoccaceae bacterium]|nr:DUF6716 putative glycosyltransferase [Geminicoccaceae bacterium]